MPHEVPAELSIESPPAQSRRFSPWIKASSILNSSALFGAHLFMKFMVRSIGHPKLTHAWLARLVQTDIAPLFAARPRLATKLQRPYVCSEWTRRERFAALAGHYDSIIRLISPVNRDAIYGDGLTLVEATNAASGRTLAVQLLYRDQFEKEGDLTLAIVDRATGLMLAGITFCMPYNEGQRLIVIGGIQASSDPRVRRLIHDVTKECHGLRPKAFALWCLQEMAAWWNVQQIQAVGDAQHIYRHSHKRREFTASYDDFWSESDGRRISPGSWEIPLRLQIRQRDELKSKRRRSHELRYVMLAHLRPHVVASAKNLAGTIIAQPVQGNLVGRALARASDEKPAELVEVAA